MPHKTKIAKKKKNSIFKNKGGIDKGGIDKGAVYVVVIITILLFGAFVMVGGTLPTKLPKVNTNLVALNKFQTEPTKSSLQIYTFSGATLTPLPTQKPLPTQLPNQPILVDCVGQIKSNQKPQMLWAYSMDSSPASGNELALKAFYTNKDSLLLGSGSVSPMTKHPTDHVVGPNVGNTGVKDIDGFPIFPAVFLTDTTFSPSDTSGDAQKGGQPNPPDHVYGTWKASGTPNPIENAKDLGPGADPWPPSNGPVAGTHDSNFTSEIIWKLSNMKALDPSTKSYLAPQSGHRYRAQIALHDGANPSNLGLACMSFLMPGALAATPTPTAPPAGPGPGNLPPPDIPIPPCTHYVAKNGSDGNPGTQAAPWLTIQHAANTAVGGNTVCVGPGTYAERVSIKKSGSNNNYITFVSQPDKGAIVDTNGKVGGSYGGAIDISGVSWIRWIGFTVKNSNVNGIQIDNKSSNIRIENNHISEIGYAGLIAMDSSYITYSSNIVTKTQKHGGGGPAGSQQNENVNMIRTNNFVIKNNIVYDVYNFESIDVKEGASYGVISGNNIYGDHPSFSAGIYVDSQTYNSSNIDIYQNKVHDSATGGSRGIAMGVENSGSVKKIKVYDNLVYNLGASGIVPGTSYSAGPVDNIVVAQNTVYNCGLTDSWGGGILVEYGPATNITVENNIAFQNGGKGNISPNGNTTLKTNFTANPNFVNPGSGDFHLQAGSGAINAGTTLPAPYNIDLEGKARPQGTAFDIGAYEQ